MKTPSDQVIQMGAYQGQISETYRSPAVSEQLQHIHHLLANDALHVLSRRDDEVTVINLTLNGAQRRVAVKKFTRQSAAKDQYDARYGSRALRSWRTATALIARGISTPQPVAYLDKWHEGRLAECYFLSRYEFGLSSFRRELIHLYQEEPCVAPLMELLQVVADAVRKMHDGGVQHRDLGNQNILLAREGRERWGNVQFIDLNRARVGQAALTEQERAFDLSRIFLPSDFMRIFTEMYFGGRPPPRFEVAHARHRRIYALRASTRRIRHPVRSRTRDREATAADTYPTPKDIWIWDDRSVQAISTLRRRDRKRMYPGSNYVHVAASLARALAPVTSNYRDLARQCFGQPVTMKNRIGIAIEPREATAERELDYLKGLGPIPVLARFYHHETEKEWAFTEGMLRRLREDGHRVSVALVQDRAAVLRTDRWAAFAERIVARVHDIAEYIELGHAVNRVKWGIWSYREYARFLTPLVSIANKYPAVKFTGPATIDFEYHHLVAALNAIPRNFHLHALSHHLYVDRRGAPENKQGTFSSVAKFVLARAIARWSRACDEKVIVSEVNWPLAGTGVYSPIGSPYLYPGQEVTGGVSEKEYAHFMLRYLVQAICSGMVERVFWWRLAAHGFGLVDDRGDWQARPAYRSLQQFLHTLGDSTFTRTLPTGGAADLLCFEQPDGTQICLGYAYDNKHPVTVDMDGKPVVLTDQPIYIKRR